MARKPNYGFEKRQKELKKQEKREEKEERKRLRKEAVAEGRDPDLADASEYNQADDDEE